jgi:hypothetical protein
MSSFVNSKDAIQQMNSELQQAQLELLSAHCAVHQLRLRYSSDDLVRFGQRDVLRKSSQAARALNQFYSELEDHVVPSVPAPALAEPTPEQAAQAVEWLTSYRQQQREHYFPVSGALGSQHKAMLRPYFSLEFLDQVRVLELHGARVAVPDFFEQIRAAGFNPPEISHMDSVTFSDVVVFNQQLSLRALFHALVHSVQIRVLGLHRYTEFWVQSFIKTRTHFTVPLEIQAFALSSKFLSALKEKFSVEEDVLLWNQDGRY